MRPHGPIHLRDEQRLAASLWTVWVGPKENDAPAVGRVVTRLVIAAGVRCDPRQIRPVGSIDRVDAVQRWIGLSESLASETIAVGRPHQAAGEDVRVGEL